jgi:DHA1 family bicyclomycin/chloramphenicol resistance-like MFS transporter
MTAGDKAGDRELSFIAVLVLATAVGPFAMQIFLPALPAIQTGFGVSAAQAQLVFSLSAFSIAVSMLAYGPISDRLGRRPALIGGLAVYLAGSVICALAPSIWILILGRIVQAAGGSAGLVLTRAIVRDRYGLERSAEMLAYVTVAMVAAPMVAPALGGVLAEAFGWRTIFWVGVALGVLILLIVWRWLPETRRLGAQPLSRNPLHGFGQLLRSSAFMGYVLNGAWSIGVFYAFLAAAPFVMTGVMGRGAGEYGLIFMMVPGAYMIGNFVAGRYSARVGTDRMILLGSIGAVVFTLIMTALMAIGAWSPWALFLPTAGAAFAQGIAMPNAQAAFVSVAPHVAGAASGLGGFLQMGIAALVAQIVGSIQDDTPYPMAVGMTLCAAAALIAALVAIRTRRPSGLH